MCPLPRKQSDCHSIGTFGSSHSQPSRGADIDRSANKSFVISNVNQSITERHSWKLTGLEAALANAVVRAPVVSVR